MKHMKKLLSLVLTLATVFALSATAMAATVTIPDDSVDNILSGHTFAAYQIFSGREENDILSDVNWGTGINNVAFLAALKADETYGNIFAACDSAAKVADALSENKNNTALAQRVAELAYDNKTDVSTALTAGDTTLADGYYLVVDTTPNVGDGGAYNKALLEIVGNIDITVKTDAPSIDKLIINADSANGNDGYGTAVDVGDVVEFKLTSKVPDMTGFNSYIYKVQDTMSAGLTAVDGDDADTAIDVTVTIGGASYTDFTVDQNGQSFTITFNNFINQKANKGQDIIITYSAILNEKALATDVEKNTVYLNYSNNPNDTSSEGKTPEHTGYVYDFDIIVDKYTVEDNQNKKLSGAKFVLLNSDKTQCYYYNETTKKVEWYTLDENETPEQAIAAGKPVTEVTTDSNGYALFKGLDAGTYYLHETAAPVGYNLLTEDTKVEITATYDNEGKLASTNTTKGNDQYSYTQAILNNKGATLPETGGIGTTIFYVLGGVMMAGAVVLMVTKRRMNAER